MIKLLIFDWDDVFTLDSKKGYFACYHETLVELGVVLTPEEEEKRIRAKWGQPHREELKELLKEKPELLDQAVALYEEKFYGDVFVSALGYVDGANDLLERLKDRYTLALATGAHPTVLKERVMPRFETPQVFTEIMSAYELTNPSTEAKPAPFMVNEILKKTDITPEETVVVGDAENDMKMGLAADTHVVAVLTGHMNETEATELGVPHIIPDVIHLEPVLEMLNS